MGRAGVVSGRGNGIKIMIRIKSNRIGAEFGCDVGFFRRLK